MSQIDDIRPRVKRTVYDCVREAGVDVADWENYKNGQSNPAANPRHCYEWAFLEAGKVAVFNLWHDMTLEEDDTVLQKLDLRAMQGVNTDRKKAGIWRRRAQAMEKAVETAWTGGLPVRVIMCTGIRRKFDDPNAQKSVVNFRDLDSALWAVTAYDKSNGRCTLTRHAFAAAGFADQFDEKPAEPVPTATRTTTTYLRNPAMRLEVLRRAWGRCELCKRTGFKVSGGRLYLETHHIVPLSDGGPDTVGNMAALCPNHHREAHHGLRAAEIREQLKALFSGK